MKTAELISDRFVYELLCEEVKPQFEEIFKYIDGDPVHLIMEGLNSYGEASEHPPKENVDISRHNAAQIGLIVGYLLGRMKDDQRVKFMMKSLLEDGSNMASSPNEKMQ